MVQLDDWRERRSIFNRRCQVEKYVFSRDENVVRFSTAHIVHHEVLVAAMFIYMVKGLRGYPLLYKKSRYPLYTIRKP